MSMFPGKSSAILFFPLSIIAGVVLCTNFVPQNYHLSVMAVIILLNIPLVCSFFSRVISLYEERLHLDSLLYLSRAELDTFKQLESQREQIRKERHEIKNNYFYDGYVSASVMLPLL